jgi:hypothetical protein
MTAVPIAVSDHGVRAGAPAALFRAPVGAVQDLARHHYIVSPDGQRFLLDTIVEEQAPPIVVILNWKPAAD